MSEMWYVYVLAVCDDVKSEDLWVAIDQTVHGSCKRISSLFLSCSDATCKQTKTIGELSQQLRD
jgi:hypothetical protein